MLLKAFANSLPKNLKTLTNLLEAPTNIEIPKMTVGLSMS